MELLGLLIVLIILIYFTVIHNPSASPEEIAKWEKERAIEKAYLKKYNVPLEADTVTRYNDYSDNSGFSCYLSINRYIMTLLPHGYKNERNVIQIPILNINYFTQKGDLYTETIIKGGGGGGSSIKGAIVGTVIAGAPGAIIGSRKKIDEISSESILVDKRKTVIEYRTTQKQKNYIYLESGAYQKLMREIPEKEKDLS